jgi:hypothetical protein
MDDEIPQDNDRLTGKKAHLEHSCEPTSHLLDYKLDENSSQQCAKNCCNREYDLISRQRSILPSQRTVTQWRSSFNSIFQTPPRFHKSNTSQARTEIALLPPTTAYYCPPRSMLTDHTLTDYCHSQFSKFPASSLLLFYAVTNKSDFRQIPWILHLPLYRATLLYALSVTRPGLFC